MRFDTWLKQAETELRTNNVPTARLDALVLAEDTIKQDRAWLLSHPDHELSSDQLKTLNNVLSQRAEHIPLAYVRGKTEFYGRTFLISPAVLEPRPESETMIDLLKKLTDLPTRPYIADVGTGSGALGITAYLELKNARVDLIDLDARALNQAKINVDLFTLELTLLQQDLLNGTDTSYDLLLCNLPYVPDNFQINTAATHEPRVAIFGGPDGLDLYRQLFQQLISRPSKPLYILTEALPPQHTDLEVIAQGAGYQLVQSADFIQVFKRSL